MDVRPSETLRLFALRALDSAVGHSAVGLDTAVMRLGNPLPGTNTSGKRCHITLSGNRIGSIKVEACGSDYVDAISRAVERARAAAEQIWRQAVVTTPQSPTDPHHATPTLTVHPA